ncbi:MAG: hypothetical protein RIC84_22250 [Aggregatilineales bacterium]
MNTKRFSLILTVLTVAILGFGLLSVPQGAKAAPPISINFQLLGAPVPGGYIADTGLAYGARGGGETFGWVTQATVNTAGAVGVDVSLYARDRNRAGIPQRQDTLIHMQFTTGPLAGWEYAVAQGTYQVEVSVGDEAGFGGIYDSQHTINVEGVNAINNFQATAAQEYFANTVTVPVTDGRLSIDAIGGNNTKINYVIITPVATPDTDGDGFDDLNDACINTFGVAPNGCPAVPPPDADGDGFSDIGDACPLVPGVAPDGCPAPLAPVGGGSAIPTDGRMNANHGDLIAAVYDISDGINIYCVNSNAQGFFSFRVDASTIAGFPANPASNTLVASSVHCAVHFYILSSGEFQINIGPDAGGDVREMVFTGFNMSNLRLSNYIDQSGGNNGVPASAPAASNNSAVTTLTNCRVTPLDILNFRATSDPTSAVLTMIPYDFTVEAINRTGDRFNVIFGDENGWVSASEEHVTTEGSCG